MMIFPESSAIVGTRTTGTGLIAIASHLADTEPGAGAVSGANTRVLAVTGRTATLPCSPESMTRGIFMTRPTAIETRPSPTFVILSVAMHAFATAAPVQQKLRAAGSRARAIASSGPGPSPCGTGGGVHCE